MFLLPVAIIQCATAVSEPAHDDLVARQHLLAIDAEVLAFLFRSPCDHQCPGDERRGVFRPAGLDGQFAEVDVVGLDDMLLAGRGLHDLWRHIQHLAEYR